MSFWTGFAWVFLLWALGWLGLPLARRIWGDSARLPGASFPDAGLAAGRMLLLILWSLLTLWCGHAGLPTRWGVFLIILPGALCVWLAVRDWPELRATVREQWRGIIAVELVFLLVFAFFFVQRGFWPDFNNGEKPMDLALMGACGRADFLPPPNPYAADTRLDSYYYLGHLQTALLTDAIHSSPRWTYNLMAGTLPALCFSILASLCGAVTGRVRNGVIGAFLVLGGGTLEPLRQWFKPPANTPPAWPFGERTIDYFATSRVIPMTINEYPWFTFSYGDVHAHYFDMPVTLTVIALGWALYWRVQEGWQARGWKIIAVLCGLALGATIMTNTWDFPTYTLYIFGCLAALVFFPGWKSARLKAAMVAADDVSRRSNQPKQSTGSGSRSGAKGKPQAETRAKAKHKAGAHRQPLVTQAPAPSKSASGARLAIALATMFAVAFSALITSSPFLTHLHTAADKPQFLWQPASPPRSWLMMWGLPMGAWVMNLALITYRRVAAGTANFRVIVAGIVLPELIWMALKWLPPHTYFWGDRQLFSTGPGEDPFVLIFLLTLLGWTAYEAIWGEDAAQVWLCRLALCGLVALCWSETTYAGFLSGGDYRRQDTVFKFGLQAWFLIGTAAVCSALRMVSPRPILATSAAEERPSLSAEDTDLAAVQPRRSAWSQWPWPVRLGYCILLPVAFISSAATTWTRLHHTSAADSTVKGMENVDLNSPLHFQGWDAWANLTEPEQDAAQWLQDHARDGENLLEAEMHDGGDYTQYTRYAQATGIPSVVGPQAHTFQWGTDWMDVYARKAAVHAYYTARQGDVLQKYKVRYIVCGELERAEYGDSNVAALEKILAPSKAYQAGLSADPQHITTIYQNP